jgi:hypothetical protein
MVTSGGLFMLTCREATQLLSEKQDRTLNFKEMSALQFHVVMCSSCRRFGKQMKSLSLLSKQYKKFDEKQKDYNKKASYFMRLSWFNLY